MVGGEGAARCSSDRRSIAWRGLCMHIWKHVIWQGIRRLVGLCRRCFLCVALPPLLTARLPDCLWFHPPTCTSVLPFSSTTGWPAAPPAGSQRRRCRCCGRQSRLSPPLCCYPLPSSHIRPSTPCPFTCRCSMP